MHTKMPQIGAPPLEFITAAACDLNGILRGKRIPAAFADKVGRGALKMPLTVLGVDIFGRDALASGQVFETGDGDGICLPTGRGLLPIDWLGTPTALLPVWMHLADGTPYAADPRHALARVVEKYRQTGLTPVCAVELEFTLYDVARGSTDMAVAPAAGGRGGVNAIYAVSEMDTFDAFLCDVAAACARMGIPAEAAISESGHGQFEINLRHVADPLRAADDAVFFKYVVKGIAATHGFGATFMAKPFGDDAGNGLHVHFSLIDGEGKNVFDDGSATGSDMLRFAVGGILDTMAANTLVFAPHYNSYRRLRAGAHAPINVSWGYENRTAALRIPDGPGTDRRIEHRSAGADANPYLVLTAILGGALGGIEARLEPPAPVCGSAYTDALPVVAESWDAAIRRFAEDPQVGKLYGPLLQRMFVASKRQEHEHFAVRVTPAEYDAYLEAL